MNRLLGCRKWLFMLFVAKMIKFGDIPSEKKDRQKTRD